RIRDSAAFTKDKDQTLKEVINAPDINLYAIDVSFAQLTDKAEREYLNNLPTSFALPDEAVDRLRTAGGSILLASPEFQRLVRDVGARIVNDARTTSALSP